MFICNVFLTFGIKRLLSGIFKFFENILLYMGFIHLIFQPLPNVYF